MKALNFSPLNFNFVTNKTAAVLEKKAAQFKVTCDSSVFPAKSESKILKALFEGESNCQKAFLKAKRIKEANAQYSAFLCKGEKVTGVSLLPVRNSCQKAKVLLTRFERPDKSFILVRDAARGNACGSAVLEYTGVPSFPTKSLDAYCKNALEVVRIDTVNKGKNASGYKGLGTELINEAVRLSKEKGFGGRIYLNANNEIPPTPFYYKCGLRFPSQEKNTLMEQYLKNGEKQGTLNELIQCGIMYLPDENIAKLL